MKRTDLPTQTLGRYQLIRELGRGGMSVVYLADDPRLKRKVAVKVMHPHLASRQESRKRFLQEATAIARLKHPNVLNVFDYSADDDEESYIVSEYIEGWTLKEWVDLHGIRLCEVAILLALPIFEALNHAHEHGIIHRDIKPENIMLRSSGNPVLMDFGIAHMVDSETLTSTGAVIGSPAHMSPEVVNGDPLSVHTDLFSMGTVLYWMLCNALPFVAPNPAALFKRILETRFDPILQRRPHVLGSIASLTEHCMKRHPNQRPVSAKEVANLLKQSLKYAGLHSLKEELSKLMKDPALYQAQLTPRLVDHYYTSAVDCVEQGDLSLALDLLKRVIYLDPHHPSADSLIQRIKRGQRKGSLLWSLTVGVCLGGAIWFWPNTSPNTLLKGDQALPNQLSSSALTKTSNTQKDLTSSSVIPSSLSPFPPPKSTNPLTPLLLGTSSSSSSSVSSESQNQQKNKQLKGPNDKKRSRTSRTNRNSRKNQTNRLTRLRSKGTRRSLNRNRRKKGKLTLSSQKRSQSLPVSVQNKGTPDSRTQQRIEISSLYKGVEVWVNQKKVGRIFEIERKKGLSLPIGQKHIIQFKSPACETKTKIVSISKKTKKEPRIVFDCRFKPATFEIKSPIKGEIYLDSNRGKPISLGQTNQEIKYQMKTSRLQLSFMVVFRSGKINRLNGTLNAGQKSDFNL